LCRYFVYKESVGLFSFLLFFVFCGAKGTAICTVTNDAAICEVVSASSATDFSCDVEDQCWALLKELAVIVPVDWVTVNRNQFERLRTKWYQACATSDIIQKIDNVCRGSDLFSSFLSWARLPSSVLLANASLIASTASVDLLDQQCGLAWAMGNCEFDGCLLGF
jgi:hypothetical protein